MLNDDDLNIIKNQKSQITPGNFCLCIKTPKSKKEKPIENNLYFVSKIISTRWGDKIVLIDISANEIWTDSSYLQGFVLTNNLLNLSKNAIDIFIRLGDAVNEYKLNTSTPIIASITAKSNKSFLLKLSSGHEISVPKSLVIPVEIFDQSSLGETISLNIPMWFAIKNNIIKNQGNKS